MRSADAAAVELRSAFAEPEDRTVAERKSHFPGRRVDAQQLHRTTILMLDSKGQRLFGNADDEVTDVSGIWDCRFGAGLGGRQHSLVERAINRNRFEPPVHDRENSDSRRQRRRGGDDDLNGTAGNPQRWTGALRRERVGGTDRLSKTDAAKKRRTLQQIAPRQPFAHFTFHSCTPADHCGCIVTSSRKPLVVTGATVAC